MLYHLTLQEQRQCKLAQFSTKTVEIKLFERGFAGCLYVGSVQFTYQDPYDLECEIIRILNLPHMQGGQVRVDKSNTYHYLAGGDLCEALVWGHQ